MNKATTDDDSVKRKNDSSAETASEREVEPSQTSSIEDLESEVSTISDSVDGNDFLKHLRAAGAFDTDLKNEDTFGFSRRRNNRQDLASLSELLFEPETSAEAAEQQQQLYHHVLLQQISNEDTIGRSNTKNSRNPQRNYQQPQLTSLFTINEPSVAPPPPATAPSLPTSRPSRSPPPLSPKSALKKKPSAVPPAFGTLSPQTQSSGGGLPPMVRPQPLQDHARSVSWGNNTTFAPATTSRTSAAAQNQSGADKEELEDNNNKRGGGGGNRPQLGVPFYSSQSSFDTVSSLENDNANHRRTNTRTQFTLEDLLGNNLPYEAEAESNIIRALEVQQAGRHQRGKTGSTLPSLSLLGRVPESAVHDFSLEGGQEEEKEREREEGNASSLETPISSMQSKDGSTRSEKVNLLNNSSTLPPQQQQQRKKNNSKATSRHRRHLSVEQTLVGLTHAMSAMHGGSLNYNETQTTEEQPFSSANAFAENATRLSEQQQRQQEPPHHTRRIWRIENLPSMVEEEHDRRVTANGDRISSPGREATTEEDTASDEDHRTDADIEAPSPPDQLGEDQQQQTNNGEVESTTKANYSRRRLLSRRNSLFLGEASDQLKNEWEAWNAFFTPTKAAHVKSYAKHITLYVIIPMISTAAILFYLCGNPTTGTSSDDGSPGDRPSVSWWLLFAVREVITFSMALAMQAIVIDFLSLGTKIMLRLVGPVLTLLIVQSKGWPFICFWWGIFDFAMLASGTLFAHHWLYWQDAIGLFNTDNPSGNVASSDLHTTILTVVVSVSAIVAVKRFVIGLYLGRQTFIHYGEKLANLLNRMLLVSEVAGLAKDIEKSRVPKDKTVPVISETLGWEGDHLYGVNFADDGTISTPGDSSSKRTVIDTSCRDPLTGSLPSHEKAKLMQLLGQWEEPLQTDDPRQFEVASISAVLRFRKALTFIHLSYPFSYAFGPADTREKCVESAQSVYNRLLMRTPGKEVLEFETLALLALEEYEDGDTVDQAKAKDLVKLFRPDREGHLTMLDFIKSVDSVYRDFRMLNASIQNSSQIDRAFENIFNIVFYLALGTIILALLGFNPLALFLSLSSVILGFAFMIGSASSKYFEGVLFILVRRPYNIGDRIHISPTEQDTSIDGSPGWVVENVTLFETIATWTPTKERCSLSNGSLASSRIINAARSPQAQFHIFLKFPIDTSYDKILIFKTAIEEYMKARPREWLALNGFRAHRIVADQGYVEYAIVIQHRESWQNVGQILDSKANLSSYCNEVAKQLNMHYRAPPLPVHVRYLNSSHPGVGGGGRGVETNNNPNIHHHPRVGSRSGVEYHPNMTTTTNGESESDTITKVEKEFQDLVQEFRQLALNKHNIRLN